ncbi:OLC1v1034277C1 [Oldenlandia corymbosa var. corymbosa]|uniref:OLC1v1034277C1 n=1 Tax=Oldenlandia corymbosa var. corymbosa TaxID=529605 RepID=A0AAV1CQY1_OLDCO|nr:OLC1v1034277C1 [Oldenlandia corymbosa var. corymbosa]
MEVVETHAHALSSFDHNSNPTFPFTPAASGFEHPERRSALVSRSPDFSGYNNSDSPVVPEGLESAVSAGDNDRECLDIGDGMVSVLNSVADPSADDDLQKCVAGEGDVAARKLERCSSDAAMRLQKAYRGYRTRRMLADSAVVVEELWWQAIDYARLNHSTISFFNFSKESPVSRWSRISLNASKVGQGLSKDAKAQKLAFQHWIEAIDPRHRYGHSLHIYYEEWCKADAGQPFFYWLDIGEGREVDLEKCPRSKLRQQCIKYLGPQEREHYEYVVIDGKFLHKQTGKHLDTMTGPKGVKWIFVMSTSNKLYAGVKKKGNFHHSSFLAGGVTLAAGRLVVVDGTLKSISAYSGHYRPTDDSLDSFLQYLKENGVNLDAVEIRRANEDYDNYEDGKSTKEVPSSEATKVSDSLEANDPDDKLEPAEVPKTETVVEYKRTLSGGLQSPRAEVPKKVILQRINSKKAASSYQLGNQLSLKWSTGVGPRIGCVADYPIELRLQALELTNLSPRQSSQSSATTPRRGCLASPVRWSSQEFANKDVDT